MSDHAVQEMLHRKLDPALVLQRIADEACELVDAASGSAVLLVGNRTLRTAATSDARGSPSFEIPLDNEYVQRMFCDRIAIYREDICDDAGVPGEVHSTLRVRSVIVAPLFHEDEPLGLLAVASPRPRAFTCRDVCTVQQVSGFAAGVVASSLTLASAAGEALRTRREPLTVLDGQDRPRVCHGDARRVSEFVADVTSPGSVAVLRTRQRVRAALDGDSLSCLLQPVINLRSGRLAGAEALARFSDLPRRGPEIWFAEAYAVGLGLELEELAVQGALRALDEALDLPAMSVNASPQALLSGRLPGQLAPYRDRNLVVEITEHVPIEDYGQTRAAIEQLRALGIRIAIDDLGKGHASVRHIAELEPDAIKLDRSFILGCEAGGIWPRLARGVIHAAHETGALVVAEGIETPAQLETARELGADLGQGYLIGRPEAPARMARSFEHLGAPAAPRRLSA